TAGVGATAASTAVYAPYVIGAQKERITWRLQTYAGSALAEHVIKPQVEAFNRA
ncbi:MAG: C4-dicarboxylate ABC transporter, partial [Gammaproteobacteria bacterium]|nr:C4-dicarboxylate ABC transporter [Gammaproteobacteria bacterium]